jgi:hypothetical protein
MTIDQVKERTEELLQRFVDPPKGARAFELFNGTLSLMIAFYGGSSTQVKTFVRDAEQIREKIPGGFQANHTSALAWGALQNLAAELEAGFIGTLQKTITGEVLTDHIALSRHILQEGSGDDSKNVAAVLAAAAFEDTLRRLAINNAIPHIEKLADVLNELKIQEILQGSQVGIANSYLNFRNSALHAQWDRIDRSGVASVLGFVEQLLLTHF